MRSLLLLLVPAAIACAPRASRHAEQDVALVAGSDTVNDAVAACMESVITRSQLGERNPRKPEHPRRRYVALRNPPAQGASGIGIAMQPDSGAARLIVAGFSWPSPYQGGGMKPPSDPSAANMAGEMLTGITTTLMQDLRDECAPSILGQPACVRVSQGRGERCTLGT